MMSHAGFVTLLDRLLRMPLGVVVVLLCALTLPMASCSKRAAIRLSGSLAHPEAVVTDLEGGRSWRRACVDRVEVHRAGDPWGRPIWAIGAGEDGCVWLTRIVYGEVPEGFVQRAPAAALTSDVRYDVSAHGWTRGFASVPWTGGGAFVHTAGTWRVADR